MSEKSKELEEAIAIVARKNSYTPPNIPDWLKNMGIKPNAKIISSVRTGDMDKSNKTDVLIKIENSEPIKISAKLANADYFGNWYGHKRFLTEFSHDTFEKLTLAATDWANKWSSKTPNLFVGVSICFGKRTGDTAQRFLDVFTPQDILSICQGYGEGNHVANCMYTSDNAPSTFMDLLNMLKPINHDSIRKQTGEFMIAYRPINPMTEGTNRGKNIYTKFQPYKRLTSATKITSITALMQLGKFVTVEPTAINHNHVLDDLMNNYNICIPRKPK